jgi:hypothetical protein
MKSNEVSCYMSLNVFLLFFRSPKKSLKAGVRYVKFGLAENRYSAQTFIYLRKNRIEHGKRVFF